MIGGGYVDMELVEQKLLEPIKLMALSEYARTTCHRVMWPRPLILRKFSSCIG